MDVLGGFIYVLVLFLQLTDIHGNRKTCKCDNVKEVLTREIFELKFENNMLASRIEQIESAISGKPSEVDTLNNTGTDRLQAFEDKIAVIEYDLYDHMRQTKSSLEILVKGTRSEKTERLQAKAELDEGLKKMKDSLKDFNSLKDTFSATAARVENQTNEHTDRKISAIEKFIEAIGKEVSKLATCLPHCSNGTLCFQGNECKRNQSEKTDFTDDNVYNLDVNVTDRITLECIVEGADSITWSKDDGPLPKDAIYGDGILIIPQARIEDAGTYTCLAVNEAGSVSSKVVLYVREIKDDDDNDDDQGQIGN